MFLHFSLICCFLTQICCTIILKNITIFGNGCISSDNFPNQIVSWPNQDLELTDWRVSSSKLYELRVEFDRVSLQGNDMLYFCTEEQYASCKSNCSCSTIDIWSKKYTWPPSNGPMYVAFRPQSPVKNTPLRRLGFRATIFEISQNATYFSCNSTFDITQYRSPLYLISPGYPRQTMPLENCNVFVQSDSSIRLRVPNFKVSENSSVFITGLNPMFQNTSISISGKSDKSVMTSYFRAMLALTINLNSNASDDFFILYLEPFTDAKSHCNADKLIHLDEEFRLSSEGYQNFTNYGNNLDCSYSLEGLLSNMQAVLQIDYFDIENNADFVIIDELNLTISNANFDSKYIAWPQGTNPKVHLLSDQLETSIGIDAQMHLLDCTCTGGRFDMRSARNLTFEMPVRNQRNITFAFCRGFECWWNFTLDHSHALILDFYRYDMDRDIPYFYLDGQFWSGVYWTAPKFWIFNRTEVAVQFKSRLSGFEKLDTGFDLLATSYIPEIINVDLCETSIKDILMLTDSAIYQYRVTSCKGRVSLVILDPFAGLYEVFDGELDQGRRLNPHQGELLISSGRLLSVRLALMRPQPNPVYEFVASDSFTSQDGSPCGGVIHYMFNDQTHMQFNLTLTKGCILYVNKILAHIRTTAPVTAYGGCTISSGKLITNSNTSSLDLYVGWMAAPFTLRAEYDLPPQTKLILGYEQDLWLSDNQTVMLASADFFDPTNKENMFKGGLVANIYHHANTSQDIIMQLIEPLGDGKLHFNNDSKIYTNADGLLKLILQNDTVLIYNSTLSGNGRFIAKVYSQDKELTTTTVTTVTTTGPTTPATSTTLKKSTSSPTTSANVTTSLFSTEASKTTTSVQTITKSGKCLGIFCISVILGFCVLLQ